MRNESMKKLGTPIGAGPGNDSENVGLEVLGTPLPEGRVELGEELLLFLVLALRCACLAALEDVVGVWPWLEDF
jgi:hypothetical protein